MKQIITSFLLLIAIQTFAQTDSILPVHTIDEIDISTYKLPISKKNIAQQTATIYKEDIERQNFQNTADALANTGFVALQKSQQGGGSPVIRGFEANRILLIVDGVRLNNLIYRGGHLQNSITIDENILERADILYGPASTIYGSDALGGAIHLQTIKAKPLNQTMLKKISGMAFGRYASVNTAFKGHFHLNYARENFASLSSFTYSDFGDLRMGASQNGRNPVFGTRDYYVVTNANNDSIVLNKNNKMQVNSGYKQYDVMQKFLYRHNFNTEHDVNFQYSTTSNVPRYDRLTDPHPTNTLASADWYYGPQKRLLVGYNLNSKNLIFGGDFHLGVHYQAIEESRYNRNFNAVLRNQRIENVNIVNVNLDFVKKLSNGTLLIGVETALEKLKSTATKYDIITQKTTPQSTRYPNGANKMDRYDLYFNYHHNFSKKLKSTLGLRLGATTLSSTHNDTVFLKLPFTTMNQKTITNSFNAGLVYNPTINLKTNASIASGFRVPNFDDLSKVFDSRTGYLIVPNIDLKPERTLTFDLGFTYYNDEISWENTVFYTRLKNAITTTAAKFQGNDSIVYDGVMSKVFSNQNNENSNIIGFASTFKVQLLKRLKAYGSISITQGNLLDSLQSPMAHIPPSFGRVGFSYDYRAIFLDAYVLFNGAKPISYYNLGGEDNEQYAPAFGTPAWATCNLKGSFKINQIITAQAGIENILDTNYRTFASGINAPGRNFYFALRCNF